MKFIKILLLISIIVFGSCKDNGGTKVKTYVDLYTNYVDSIVKLPLKDATKNWVKIQFEYQNIKIDLDESFKEINEKKNIQKRVDSFSLLYKKYRKQVLSESKRLNLESAKILLAKSLFGIQYKDDKKVFRWVNENNISGVYTRFYENAQANRSSYFTEDWNEIKSLYKSLELRRKTIEELNTLSSVDKENIKDIKLKFAALIPS